MSNPYRAILDAPPYRVEGPNNTIFAEYDRIDDACTAANLMNAAYESGFHAGVIKTSRQIAEILTGDSK